MLDFSLHAEGDELVEYPRLKANFVADVVDGTKVFLVAEDEHYLVQGGAAVQVLPFLDGRHTVVQIATALAAGAPLSETFRALRKFEMSGLLAEGRPDLPEDQLAYWDSLRVDPAIAVGRLAAVELTVVALGGVATEPVVAALQAAGMRARVSTARAEIEAPAGRDGLTVVLVDDYLNHEVAELNRAFLAARRRWVLARPSGMVLWCGPVFEPMSTGCWACMEQRISANRQVERYVRDKALAAATGERRPAVQPVSSAGPAVLAGVLAQEVAKLVVGVGPPKLPGTLVTFDTRTLEMAEHILIRQPQCPACGDHTLITQRSPKVVLAGSRPALYTTDGGYRVEQPTETFERLKKHVSPLLGAVTSLTVFTGSDNGVAHSYSAGHNFAMAGDSMSLLRRNLRGQSGGKGRTDIQARVSALGEAIERYTGVWLGNEPVTRAAYQVLGADIAVHPAEFLMFSPAQEAVRDAWNADPANRLQIVPEPFRTDLPIDWSSAWSLTFDRERKVPSAYAWFGHPDLDRQFFCYADSNGNAAGNTLEEAIVQGFCEVVERDAVAIWWYNRLRCPGFDLDSLDDPYVETLRRFYAGVDRRIWVLDISTDLGIPTFCAVSQRVGHPVEDILVGFGAHLDARVAVIRALTEVNQFFPAVERRDAGGDTVYLEDDVATLAWWREAKVSEEPWLVADPDVPARTPASYPVSVAADLAENVNTCVRRAEVAGLEVIVLDQTRPDLDLHVAKVMVPGMRHFWRRLGSGRLYDVPVAMGRLAAPLDEHEVNPRSVFF
jgi:oxazoline/thiazoline synthase